MPAGKRSNNGKNPSSPPGPCKDKPSLDESSSATIKKKRSVGLQSAGTSVKLKSVSDSVQVCPVCEEYIDDGIHDSIYCDSCDAWLHRGCAGLSRLKFSNLNNSTEPFQCVSCQLTSHSKEIQELRSALHDLQDVVAKLSRCNPNNSLSSSGSSGNIPTYNSISVLPATPPDQSAATAATSPSQSTTPTQHKRARTSSGNRKLNIVVYGVKECKAGSPRQQRWLTDLKQVTSLFTECDKPAISVSGTSIRDCRRLGKYSPGNEKPRPILVSFNSCTSVIDILRARSSFLPYIVKPDLSPSQRETDKLLLKERWVLIQSGTERKNIKIKRSSLYVDGHLFGEVKNSTFIPSSPEIDKESPADDDSAETLVDPSVSNPLVDSHTHTNTTNTTGSNSVPSQPSIRHQSDASD